MAIEKLVMANVVCRRNRLDEIIRDLILLERSEFVNTFLEIDDGDFSIGISEENADEILDMEDIVPLKENKEIEQVIQRFETTLQSLKYQPNIDTAYMKGVHNFDQMTDEVEKLSCKFAVLTEEVTQIESRIETLEKYKVIESIKNIDIDLKKLLTMDHFTMKLGFLMRDKAKRISQNYDNIKALVLHAGTFEEKEFYIIVSPKSLDVEMGRILRSTDFMQINLEGEQLETPEKLVESIENEKIECKNRLTEIETMTQKDIEENSQEFDKLYSTLILERKIDEVRTKVAVTENLAYLSAWVPAEDMARLTEIFGPPPETLVTFKKSGEVSSRIPTPTFLKNNRFFKSFERIIKIDDETKSEVETLESEITNREEQLKKIVSDVEANSEALKVTQSKSLLERIRTDTKLEQEKIMKESDVLMSDMDRIFSDKKSKIINRAFEKLSISRWGS